MRRLLNERRASRLLCSRRRICRLRRMMFFLVEAIRLFMRVVGYPWRFLTPWRVSFQQKLQRTKSGECRCPVLRD